MPFEFHATANGMTSLFSALAAFWPDFGADDGTGLVMPGLAGSAAATTVALALAIYFQTGYRSYRDMIRHGLVAALGLTLLAFAIFDMRTAALAHISMWQIRPTAQFELQWLEAAGRAGGRAAGGGGRN